jgi:hypothetical protein
MREQDEDETTREPWFDMSASEVAHWTVIIAFLLLIVWGLAEADSGNDQGSENVHCTQDIGFMGQQEVYCEPVR